MNAGFTLLKPVQILMTVELAIPSSSFFSWFHQLLNQAGNVGQVIYTALASASPLGLNSEHLKSKICTVHL